MILLFFKQKTAYEVRISDWSSDVCSSDRRADGEGVEVAVEKRQPALPRPPRQQRRHQAVQRRFIRGDREKERRRPLHPLCNTPVGIEREGRRRGGSRDRNHVVPGKCVDVRIATGDRRALQYKNKQK